MLKVEVKDGKVGLTTRGTDISECFYAIDTLVKSIKENTSISNVEILELFKEICLEEEEPSKKKKEK